MQGGVLQGTSEGSLVVYIVGVVCNEAMGVAGEGQVWVDVVPE